MPNTMTMPTFAQAYPGLFLGTWRDEKKRVQRPEDFGLALEDALVEVCALCLWQDCDACRLANQETDVAGPPPLAQVLLGEDYYDTLPTPEPKRDPEAELDDSVEAHGDALYFARENKVVFPNAMRWVTFREAEAEVESHPAFKQKEAPMTEQKTLVLYCDGGRRANGTAYGSVKMGGRVWRQEFGPGSNNEAEYKALIDALFVACREVEQHGYDLVEIRMDSELVRNQVLGAWRVKAPALQPLHERARQELNALLAAMRRKPADLARVRFVHVDEAQMKRVIGH
jgi:ribonuclease HI